MKPRQNSLFQNAAKALTNGHVDKTYVNGVHYADMTTHPSGVTSSVNGDVATDGSAQGVVTHDLAPVTLPRVFVWSSFDEAGIKRLTSTLLEYLGKKARDTFDEKAYLRDLSYTLAVKRTSFP